MKTGKMVSQTIQEVKIYTELMSNGRWNDLPNHNSQLNVIEFSGTVSSLPTTITYTATESESGEFTIPTVAPIVIPAGSSKATLTISAKLRYRS